VIRFTTLVKHWTDTERENVNYLSKSLSYEEESPRQRQPVEGLCSDYELKNHRAIKSREKEKDLPGKHDYIAVSPCQGKSERRYE